MDAVKNQIVDGGDPCHILLIGNNPIEMGRILESLKQVKGKTIVTEIAFDIQSVNDRLMKFNPDFILIDDNIGRVELGASIAALAEHKKTREVPITVLKNSNYAEALTSKSILDYLLKQNLSPESLYNTIKNSLKFRRTQRYLSEVYRLRKNLFHPAVSA
jgi:DNA-binding NarL/FixJ family response regulator